MAFDDAIESVYNIIGQKQAAKPMHPWMCNSFSCV